MAVARRRRLLRLDHGGDAPARARRAVHDLLVGIDATLARDAALAVSELVSNVFLHTDDGCELCVTLLPPDGVRVEVTDTSRALPRLNRHREPDSVGGLGLSIVEQLATRWGVRRRPSGKTIWAELWRQPESPKWALSPATSNKRRTGGEASTMRTFPP